jgi:soluble lytic murein transglycosylase
MLFKNGGKVLLCLMISVPLFASLPQDISFFDDKPRGIAKDFYILRYLESTTCSKEDAWKLLEQISRMNLKLFHALANKLDDEDIKKVSSCMKMPTKELLKEDRDCIAIGLSAYEATTLDKKTLTQISTLLEPYIEAVPLKVLSTDNIYQTMIQGNSDDFFETFNKVGAKYRQEHFDKEIVKEKLEELAKDTRINQSIHLIVTDKKLLHVKKSLLDIDPNDKQLIHKSLFYLGLNALQHNQKDLALRFFERAHKKAYQAIDKDKVLFWQYLVTKDEKYKEQVQKSFDLNIYTLLMEQKNQNIIVAQAYETHPSFDVGNPFGWTKFHNQIRDNNSKEELKELAKTYLYGSTIAHYSYIMAKVSDYKDHYYPIPYQQYLKGYDNKRVALILALARQESKFIPSAISTSYALGIMQFMPFLAEAIAKEKGFVDFELEDMFNPETAYMFANIHLNYLEKYLYHPLFVAYAYNGGIGFTKRLLLKDVFNKGPYEPYMSMELVPYDESREYGKKVLANYIVYMQILGEKVSVKNLLEELLEPEKTDKFREKP